MSVGTKTCGWPILKFDQVKLHMVYVSFAHHTDWPHMAHVTPRRTVYHRSLISHGDLMSLLILITCPISANRVRPDLPTIGLAFVHQYFEYLSNSILVYHKVVRRQSLENRNIKFFEHAYLPREWRFALQLAHRSCAEPCNENLLHVKGYTVW